MCFFLLDCGQQPWGLGPRREFKFIGEGLGNVEKICEDDQKSPSGPSRMFPASAPLLAPWPSSPARAQFARVEMGLIVTQPPCAVAEMKSAVAASQLPWVRTSSCTGKWYLVAFQKR